MTKINQNGISINAGFEFGSAQPVDSRQWLTTEQMLNADVNVFPDPYFAINTEDHFVYIFSKKNDTSATTGYFKKYTQDGGYSQWVGTEEDYQALETKDARTIYITPGHIRVGEESIVSDKQTFNLAQNVESKAYIDINNPFTYLKDFTNWEASILPCKEGDRFLVSGRGGSLTYPLYAFVKSDGTLITSASAAAKGEFNLVAPEESAFLICNCNCSTGGIPLQISRVYHKPTKLRVTTFNCGKWYDGVTKPQTSELIAAEKVNIHRFLGEVNPDFLLMEEAYTYINEDNTINAYNELIRFKLPFRRSLYEYTDTGIAGKLMATGKYKINNYTSGTYASGSGQALIQFDSVIDGKTIHFIICHLSYETSPVTYRAQDMAELKTILSSYEYGVLCGDFNCYTIDEFDIYANDFNMANHGDFGDFDTWHENDGSTTDWNECLDNIITTKNISIQNVFKYEKSKMSDHQPLTADLVILA